MLFPRRLLIHVLSAALITALVVIVFVPPGFAQNTAPRPEAIKWLDDHAIRFRTAEAGNGFDDLEPLRDLIGNARIVALGEGTHGTREFFQMKHRLTEWLATEMGFTIFSIEASTPEAYRLNGYVLGGDGDPGELIAGMYFWTWRTEEVLAMVEWMREFNASGRGRIQFTGFDMQTPDVAIKIVRDFMYKHDTGFYSVVLENYGTIDTGAKRKQTFGVVTMNFPVGAARGKKVTYAGWIKTENLQDGVAGLWWRVDSAERTAIAFDNMMDRGPTGTTDWTRYEIVLDVAEEATNINFGVIMPGDGRAWYDGLEVELDGEPYLNARRFDFDFEKPSMVGYFASNGGGYMGTLVDDVYHSGKQSMRLEKMDLPEDVAEPSEQVGAAWEVLDRMTTSRDRYIESVPAKDVDWVIHNANIVHQCSRMMASSSPDVRDRSMAENVGWILDQNPGEKIVLWAHNGHVERNKGRMGQFLDEVYGEGYLPVGFAANEGEYVAVGEGSLGQHPLLQAPAGSIESFFAATGEPRLILDLRGRGDESATGWLEEPRLFRSIGAMAMDNQFHPAVIADRFDLLIFFRDTKAAIQL